MTDRIREDQNYTDPDHNTEYKNRIVYIFTIANQCWTFPSKSWSRKKMQN